MLAHTPPQCMSMPPADDLFATLTTGCFVKLLKLLEPISSCFSLDLFYPHAWDQGTNEGCHSSLKFQYTTLQYGRQFWDGSLNFYNKHNISSLLIYTLLKSKMALWKMTIRVATPWVTPPVSSSRFCVPMDFSIPRKWFDLHIFFRYPAWNLAGTTVEFYKVATLGSIREARACHSWWWRIRS